MKTYLAHYTYGGEDWHVEFKAEDNTDAARRARAIRRTLEVDGEQVLSVKLGFFDWNVVKRWLGKQP